MLTVGAWNNLTDKGKSKSRGKELIFFGNRECYSSGSKESERRKTNNKKKERRKHEENKEVINTHKK